MAGEGERATLKTCRKSGNLKVGCGSGCLAKLRLRNLFGDQRLKGDFRTITNDRAGGLLARAGSLSGHPTKQHPRSMLLDPRNVYMTPRKEGNHNNIEAREVQCHRAVESRPAPLFIQWRDLRGGPGLRHNCESQSPQSPTIRDLPDHQPSRPWARPACRATTHLHSLISKSGLFYYRFRFLFRSLLSWGRDTHYEITSGPRS
ncbi:hypothetical protein J6590_051590 [Homalodisca vitripennis]|nr:hypothetical protein J6590_051590 [Homalodisca vitripennis]